MGDSVNIDPQPARKAGYHHGQLRDALVEAGMDLARAQGPAGLGLRAASRIVGVSHNAAYRHFADHDALLAAVSERCMARLAAHMRARVDEVEEADPIAAAWGGLYAIGTAYVEFAVSETGWFRTAFLAHATAQAKLVAASGPSVEPGERSPFDLLNDCLDDLVTVGAVPAGRRPGLEMAAWSAVHGLSTLLTDGPLQPLPGPMRPEALRVVLDVVASGLPQAGPAAPPLPALFARGGADEQHL